MTFPPTFLLQNEPINSNFTNPNPQIQNHFHEMTIDHNDWELFLSFDDDSVLPQNLDDLFFHGGTSPIDGFAEEIAAEADPNLAGDAPKENTPSWIGEIENFLMQDDDDQSVNHEEILLSPATSPPLDKDSSDSKDADSDSAPERAEIDADGLSKKELRQLRNRDAAVRSRERKKSYVKDLEMKSRFMEAECRRLDRLLQCCYAENHMLRVSLHNAAAFSGCSAKAESAVLLLESLLLVSLLWLLATVSLLPPPKEAVSLENASKELEAPPPKSKGSKLTELWAPPSFLSKKCRSSRTKMKAALLESGSFSMFMMAVPNIVFI